MTRPELTLWLHRQANRLEAEAETCARVHPFAPTIPLKATDAAILVSLLREAIEALQGHVPDEVAMAQLGGPQKDGQ